MLVVLGLGGFVSLLVGLSWDTVLHALATDLARSQNAFNLINPDHILLTHAIVAGIVGFGHFLFVFGVAVMIVGLIVATYLRLKGNPRWTAASFRRAFVAGTGALVLLAVGSTTWATGAVSYEDHLIAMPPAPSASSAGHKEHHTDCTQQPTPQQQEAADELAAETKAGVAKYTDLSAAEVDGYRPISPIWQPITHYLNPAYQRDGKILDPSRPEALVYANTSKGPVLLGAMYLMPEPSVPGVQIGGCLTHWHAHSLLGWETPEMIHVWAVNVPGGPCSDEVRPRALVPLLER